MSKEFKGVLLLVSVFGLIYLYYSGQIWVIAKFIVDICVLFIDFLLYAAFGISALFLFLLFLHAVLKR